MSRVSSRIGFVVATLLLVLRSVSQAAVPPAENLLPNTTKGFLAAASVQDLEDNWNKTQLGQLMQDAAMKPFVEDLQRQMQDKWLKTHQKLGITWEDLEKTPSGETAIAIVLPSPTESATVVVADVTGHQEQTAVLLEKIDRSMVAQKAVRRTHKVSGTVITVYDIPKTEDEAARQVAYFVKDDLLATADNLKVIVGIAARQAEAKADSLAKQPAFNGHHESLPQGRRRIGPARPLVYRAVRLCRRGSVVQRSAAQEGHRHAQDSQAAGFYGHPRALADSSISMSSRMRFCTARSSMPRATGPERTDSRWPRECLIFPTAAPLVRPIGCRATWPHMRPST